MPVKYHIANPILKLVNLNGRDDIHLKDNHGKFRPRTDWSRPRF